MFVVVYTICVVLKEIEYINGKYQKWGDDWRQRLRDISKTYKLHVSLIQTADDVLSVLLSMPMHYPY